MYKHERYQLQKGVRYPICEDCGDKINERRLLYDNYGDIYCMKCARKRFKYELDDSLIGEAKDYIVY